MIEPEYTIIITISIFAAFLLLQSLRRPSEEVQENQIRERLENEVGPAMGGYGGINYKFDLIGIEVHEQNNAIYQIFRLPTARFRGKTHVRVRFSGPTPAVAGINSHPWLKRGDLHLQDFRADGDELRFVIPSSDPHRVKRSFDALRIVLDHVLSSDPVSSQQIGNPPSGAISRSR